MGVLAVLSSHADTPFADLLSPVSLLFVSPPLRLRHGAGSPGLPWRVISLILNSYRGSCIGNYFGALRPAIQLQEKGRLSISSPIIMPEHD